jgi:magnesium/cobalt transport protein CorA
MELRLIEQDGVRVRPVADLPELLELEDALIWLDIQAGDEAAGRVLSEVFRFHPLAVQDSLERNRVPKVHAYKDHLLVILHTPERGERGHVHYIELDQIIGRNYLVTVHGPVNPAVAPEVSLRETQAVMARIEAGRLSPKTSFDLSYAIVSALTRTQETYVETATKDVWRLEQRVTGGDVGAPEAFLDELFRARHGLLAVRTMAALGSEIYGRMGALPGIMPHARHLINDLGDQFNRVRSVADGQREYLQGVLEFYQTVLTIRAALVGQAQSEEVQRLTEASYAQNEEIKRISAWAAILFAPTLIGTVYGMNFDHMPELHWLFGYPVAIVLMLLTSVGLYLVFKRRGWL